MEGLLNIYATWKVHNFHNLSYFKTADKEPYENFLNKFIEKKTEK